MRKNIIKAKSFSVPLNNPVIAKGSGMKSNDNFFFMFITRTVVLTEGFSCSVINLTKIHTIVKQCELKDLVDQVSLILILVLFSLIQASNSKNTR